MRPTTVVMTYFNRKWQTLKTLESIAKSKHDNFKVLVVDDASDVLFTEDIDISLYPFKIEVIRVEKGVKDWSSPVPIQNMGVTAALKGGAEVLILQNAEAKHIGDPLVYAEENLTEDNYLSFACFSLSKQSTFDPNLDDNLDSIIEAHNVCAVDSEHDSWYNCGFIRGTFYDFCSAITKGNMLKLNGYDERYAAGCCYSDDDLVMRIKRLGLKMEIPRNPFVVHQYHASSGGAPNFEALTIKNRELYNKLACETIGYRAEHIYTPDL
jgi:glycosyltransferase involved in cell wall biosynthesis